MAKVYGKLSDYKIVQKKTPLYKGAGGLFEPTDFTSHRVHAFAKDSGHGLRSNQSLLSNADRWMKRHMDDLYRKNLKGIYNLSDQVVKGALGGNTTGSSDSFWTSRKYHPARESGVFNGMIPFRGRTEYSLPYNMTNYDHHYYGGRYRKPWLPRTKGGADDFAAASRPAHRGRGKLGGRELRLHRRKDLYGGYPPSASLERRIAAHPTRNPNPPKIKSDWRK